MKIVSRICFLPALAAVLAGCNGSKQEVLPEITLTGTSAQLVSTGISAPATESEVTLTFTSATRWTILSDEGTKAAAGWVVANPPAGEGGAQSVTLYINANPDLSGRNAVLNLVSGNVTRTIQVSQAAREAVKNSEIFLSETSLELLEGDTFQLMATVIPTYSDESAYVEWSTSDESVASVDENGLVTAFAEGSATISATVGELTAECEVRVGHIDIPVESVSLDQTSLTMVLDQEVQLTATVNPANADEKTLSWSTSDETVATVSQDGLVKAVGEGEATITVTCGGKSATCEVSVPHVYVPVASVTLDKPTASIYPQETVQLVATVNPANADEPEVTWSTSDGNVASVDENGLVTANAEGEATITASAGEKSATCVVTVMHKVIEVESVSLDQTSLTMVLDQEVTLTATVNPANADEKTVTWSTSDGNVATVSQNGVVKAVGEGEATITASCGGKSATCAVNVPHVAVPVTSVTLDKTEATILPGGTLQLTATVNPDNADDPTVTWTSSDQKVATVSNNGLVTGVKAGKVTITATAGGKSATCAVLVKATGNTGEDLDDPIIVNPWE